MTSCRPVQDNIHVDLKQHVKGKIYGDKSKEPDSDPRESLYAQRCYRVWVQEGLVGDATLLLVPEVRLSPFYECATCGRYAEDPCAGKLHDLSKTKQVVNLLTHNRASEWFRQ